MATKNRVRGGSFHERPSGALKEFWNSIGFDRRLLAEDIEGSMAHVAMLKACGILSKLEARKIATGLRAVYTGLRRGKLTFSSADEDVHMNVERLLQDRIGRLAGKLHTARSRNDQVALDMHLFVRKECARTVHLLSELQVAFCDQVTRNGGVLIPGYTHLQRAQPVLLGHHLMAHCWSLQRDISRVIDCWKRASTSPLGAGALAGTTFSIDPERTARSLGLDGVYLNSMDAVSDRDFVAEMLAANAIIAAHLSRLCEEIVLWSTTEFGFITLSDSFSTGSSMMPQKKNPDLAELVRGKTGRVYGSLMAFLTVIKGLPLTYNKDLQEDKESLFDSVDTVQKSLLHVSGMISTLEVNVSAASEAVRNGFLNATDLVEYLAKKGLPFREAHSLVGRIVAGCLRNKKELQSLTLAELRGFSKRIEEDIFAALDLDTVVKQRRSLGGTAPEQLDRQFAAMQDHIRETRAWLKIAVRKGMADRTQRQRRVLASKIAKSAIRPAPIGRRD